MAINAIHSNAVCLLSLIHYFLFPCVCGCCVESLLCNTVSKVFSCFFNRLTKKEIPVRFSLIVFMLSCVCLCSVPLPCGAVGLSVVYCCGMPWSSADSENSVRGPINAFFNHQ